MRAIKYMKIDYLLTKQTQRVLPFLALVAVVAGKGMGDVRTMFTCSYLIFYGHYFFHDALCRLPQKKHRISADAARYSVGESGGAVFIRSVLHRHDSAVLCCLHRYIFPVRQ